MEKESVDNFSRTLPIKVRSYREEKRHESEIQRGLSFKMGYSRA